MGSDLASSVAMTVAATAVAVGASLSVLQTDSMSRRILSPESLEAKRRAEYKYRWDKALQKAMYMQRQTFQFFNDYELLTEKKEIQELIEKLFQKKPSSPDMIRKQIHFNVVAIEHDHEDPRALQEYFLFLVVNTNLKLQVSLIDFGLAMADAAEKELTSTALCFVADASSGRGTDMLATLLRECQSGVTVIEEPLWMSFLADIANRNVIAKSKMERILFGFCRLEASKADVGSARTVMFTLPGQACSPILMPLLQAVFPCERHVFCYSGCVAAVKQGLLLENTTSKTELIAPRVLSSTPVMKAPRLRKLPQALAKLPLNQADTVEAWISTVDVFLSLKEQEKENNYLPFVLKLSNLFEGSLDEEKSSRRLALVNILQFVTGSRSRPLPQSVVDAAVESLKDISAKDKSESVKVQTKLIEDCVFLHKGILIENKTLLDTVNPSTEWTLKAAKRISGCLCCAPEEDDEEEEKTAMNNLATPGAFATMNNRSDMPNKRPKYVDGKTAFAFDPTKF